MDYFPLINKYGCTYIDKNLPSEILNFDEDAYFDVAVSITSTQSMLLIMLVKKDLWAENLLRIA